MFIGSGKMKDPIFEKDLGTAAHCRRTPLFFAAQLEPLKPKKRIWHSRSAPAKTPFQHRACPWSASRLPDQGLFLNGTLTFSAPRRIPQKTTVHKTLRAWSCSHGGLRLGSYTQSGFLPSSGPLAARQCVALFLIDGFSPSGVSLVAAEKTHHQREPAKDTDYARDGY